MAVEEMERRATRPTVSELRDRFPAVVPINTTIDVSAYRERIGLLAETYEHRQQANPLTAMQTAQSRQREDTHRQKQIGFAGEFAFTVAADQRGHTVTAPRESGFSGFQTDLHIMRDDRWIIDLSVKASELRARSDNHLTPAHWDCGEYQLTNKAGSRTWAIDKRDSSPKHYYCLTYSDDEDPYRVTVYGLLRADYGYVIQVQPFKACKRERYTAIFQDHVDQLADTTSELYRRVTQRLDSLSPHAWRRTYGEEMPA